MQQKPFEFPFDFHFMALSAKFTLIKQPFHSIHGIWHLACLFGKFYDCWNSFSPKTGTKGSALGHQAYQNVGGSDTENVSFALVVKTVNASDLYHKFQFIGQQWKAMYLLVLLLNMVLLVWQTRPKANLNCLE